MHVLLSAPKIAVRCSPEEGEKKRPAPPFHHCGCGGTGGAGWEEMGATLMARCCCGGGAAVAMLRLRLSPSPRPPWPCCSRSLALTAISIDVYSELGFPSPGNRVVLAVFAERETVDGSIAVGVVCGNEEGGGVERALLLKSTGERMREIISGVMMP